MTTPAQPQRPDAIHRPFFLAGLLVILTAGAGWGVMILGSIGMNGSYTSMSALEVNAHGHAQIMGWVGLFIMGFAYQMFPRLWRTRLPAPRLALASLLLMIGGIIARIWAMLSSGDDATMTMHLFGIVAEVAAVTIFVTLIVIAFVRSRQAIAPSIMFAFTALAYFFIQSVYSGWHMHQLLLLESDREAFLHQIATYQATLRDIQIHGLAMMMIFAVSLRLFPALFAVPEVSTRRAWWGFGLLSTAIALEIVVFLIFQLTESYAVAGLMLVPWLLLPIGAGVIVAPWRLWRSLPGRGRTDRSAKFIRIAFGWLFVSFALLLLLPVYRIVSDIQFSHAYYGSIRHAITVGFISMMIVGMASKFVPILRGVAPQNLPHLWLPFAMINLGCFLRVSLQIGTDWHPVFFKFVGVSGVLEWTGLAIWAFHMTTVMLGAGHANVRPSRVLTPSFSNA